MVSNNLLFQTGQLVPLRLGEGPPDWLIRDITAGTASAETKSASQRIRFAVPSLFQHGGAVQVESSPADPALESAWFQPLNLSSEKLVSKFAFKFNLYRYSLGVCTARTRRRRTCTSPARSGFPRRAVTGTTGSESDDVMDWLRRRTL